MVASDAEIVVQTGFADRARDPLGLEVLHTHTEVVDVSAGLALGNTQERESVGQVQCIGPPRHLPLRRQAEELPVEVDRSVEVRVLEVDMIDVDPSEHTVLLRALPSRRASAAYEPCRHRFQSDSLDQLPSVEGSPVEVAEKGSMIRVIRSP